jgi:hypothetical protein
MKTLATFAVMLALIVPAHAATDDAKEKDLRNTGDNVAFVMACPKHWAQLPPRTQRIIMSLGDDAAARYGKDAVRAAAIAAYADGYDKQGDRWCASMQKILDDAGRF